MKKVLTKEVHEELAVADAKLGSVIKVCMPDILGDLNVFFYQPCRPRLKYLYESVRLGCVLW